MNAVSSVDPEIAPKTSVDPFFEIEEKEDNGWKEPIYETLSIMGFMLKMVLLICICGTALLYYFKWIMMHASRYEYARAEDGHPSEAISTLWRHGPATEALDSQDIFIYIAGFFVQGFLVVCMTGWITGMVIDWNACGALADTYRRRFMFISLFWAIFYACVIVMIGYEEFTAPPALSSLVIIGIAWILFLAVAIIVIRSAASMVLATGLAKSIIWASVTALACDIYLKRVAGPLFFSDNLLLKTLLRFTFVPWRAFAVGVTLRLVMNIKAEDGSDRKVVRGHFLHIIAIPVMAQATFSARLLQIGGSGFWEGLMMETIAVALEFVEVHDLVQLKTTVDNIVELVQKIFKKKEKTPVEHGGRASVLVSSLADSDQKPMSMREVTYAFMILDSMMAESTTSVLALMTLIVFRINMEPNATSYDLGKILSNGIVSTLGEVVISDSLVIYALATYYKKRTGSLGGKRLFDIWKDQQAGFRRTWILISLGLLSTVSPYFVRFLCPAFDENGDLFHRGCSTEINDAALKFGETGIYVKP